jgi:antibiotic biosynthesis monooxygenase (ABM) superfamily enzyme
MLRYGQAVTENGHQGIVYLLRCPLNRRVKIGFTASSLAARIAKIERQCPVEIELAAAVSADAGYEFELHARFADQRWNGEWFDPSPELDALIAELAALPEGHTVISALPGLKAWLATNRHRLDEIAHASGVQKQALVYALDYPANGIKARNLAAILRTRDKMQAA